MYVLSTDRGELHYFPSPEDVPGGYAILSHVWDKSEQTFEDVQRIAKWCEGGSANPRDFVSQKIRKCCILAEKHGYGWIWNDTCCIDKRSSTELSEAINSMFRYYSLAKVCYAYLRNVPHDDIPRARRSAFRESVWHRRGWTLQELVAPGWLVFVSKDWRPLGGRRELADVLEEITKIPAPLLRLEMEVSDYSVAQRMSWAAERETTRVEDRAYSLMGLFGIHMSTLYGEGENAFRRLQEEIMRRSVDPSLFLWDHFWWFDPKMMENTTDNSACHHDDRCSYLLAASPDAFTKDCSDVVFRPFGMTGATRTGPQIEEPGATENHAATNDYGIILSKSLPAFTLTPYGVHAYIPVVQGTNGVLIAILPCFQAQDGKPLGLLLFPCMHSSDYSRPLYHTRVPSLARVVYCDDLQSLCDRDGSVVVEWKEVYITPWPPLQQARILPHTLPINTMFSPPFRISEASLYRLDQQSYRIHAVSPTSSTWTGTPHITVVFRQMYRNEFITICLGRCESRASSRDARLLGPHWAAITFYISLGGDHTSIPEFPGHACPDDHVRLWPDGRKCVRDPHLSGFSQSVDWRLSFTPCQVNPDITLVADLESIKIRR